MVPVSDKNEVTPDDRWEYRAKRQEFLTEFGFPGTPAGDRMEEALSELTDALLREAMYHATWPVATAEKWRYDRMLWVFGVMLGEIPADTHAPCDRCAGSGTPCALPISDLLIVRTPR